MPSGLRCKAVLIMEAVKMKVSIFLLGDGERSEYKMFLNETLPNGVLISGLVTVFDYWVPFQLCGGLLCRVRNIPPQLPPQQYSSGSLEAQVPLCWLIVACQDCQPHFTAFISVWVIVPFKEKGKVDLKHSEQRSHLSAYLISL